MRPSPGPGMGVGDIPAKRRLRVTDWQAIRRFTASRRRSPQAGAGTSGLSRFLAGYSGLAREACALAQSGQLSRPFDDPGAENGVPCLDPSLGYMPAVLGVRL